MQSFVHFPGAVQRVNGLLSALKQHLLVMFVILCHATRPMALKVSFRILHLQRLSHLLVVGPSLESAIEPVLKRDQ